MLLKLHLPTKKRLGLVAIFATGVLYIDSPVYVRVTD